ncbi:MAG: SDR family NAD(P)-dependent oxidoreductase [Myxococcales bacterium]|nr:SDR family NAD(P)-dependent oxidoreductase [Myxococcales bacterium]MCB9531558.1 SDR family NAD(P)-dependent oxidoreductase [Myxococcales bacterium]MCB9532791.1 SDR family NAD(P)-dependent oxidoreductase [Myxococcales bacterium]
MRRSPFAGEIALVTGAGSGIGAALCGALTQAGARVVATDLSLDALAPVPAELRARLDVTEEGGFARVAAEVEAALGAPIGVLVNNAGIGLAGPIEATSMDDWRAVVEVNLLGVARGVDAIYPTMIARRAGTIINVASGAGLCPRPGMAAYAATKAAVVALSTSLRAEAARHRVGVSVACPGYIATNIMASTRYRGVDPAALAAAIPIRPMTAESCARVILAGAARGAAVIPVSRLTALEWRLTRFAPALVDLIAARRAETFARAARE